MSNSPTSPGRVRVYCAASLDGYIAGRGGDLSWLPDDASHETVPDDALTYEVLMADVGAMLMGRTTYDTVRGFDVPWPYGDLPFFVATHRALDDDAPPSVRAVSGAIADLVARAHEAAAGRDVYLDGGALIGQACDAGLVDELTVTLVPVALGGGHPLFGGLVARYDMRIVSTAEYPRGCRQVRLVPQR